jgi:hypothetical protein
MRYLLAILLLSTVTGAANAADAVLAPGGLGPVAIGSSISQMERLLRQQIPGSSFDDGGCAVVAGNDKRQLGISYLMESRRVTRINVDYYGDAAEPLTIHTEAGIGLGSSEEDVKKAYGDRVRIEPNSGDPTWHYLYVDEPDHLSGLAFDTDGKTVKSMHAGVYPALNYKQGCH